MCVRACMLVVTRRGTQIRTRRWPTNLLTGFRESLRKVTVVQGSATALEGPPACASAEAGIRAPQGERRGAKGRSSTAQEACTPIDLGQGHASPDVGFHVEPWQLLGGSHPRLGVAYRGCILAIAIAITITITITIAIAIAINISLTFAIVFALAIALDIRTPRSR